MKKSAILPAALLAAFASLDASATLFWDINGATDGAGGSTPAGTWDTTTSNWSTDSTGLSGTTTWTSGESAVFSAGSDATGAFTINLSAAQTASALTVEEGIVSFSGSAVTINAGSITIANGAKLSIPSTTNIVASAGANLNLDGGTMRSTVNGAGSSFISANFTINLGVLGGTVETANTGTNSTIFSGTIKGVGNTLTKTGSGEFRFQGAGTGTTTFSKLVVNQGLFRLGNSAGNNFETGFGAVPASFTSDAITLSGGGLIGTSYTVTLDVNRGITLGAGGGGINASSGSMTVPGAITGSGGFTVAGGTVALNGANTFTGGVTINAGTTTVGASGALASQSVNLVGTAAMVVNGQVNGSAQLVKSGTGILTLTGANTFSGGVDLSDGRINFNNSSAAGSGVITVEAGADEFVSSTTGINLANNITLASGANPKIYATSGNALTLSGTVSGSGGFLRDDTGAGTLTLAGSNTFGGGFKITSRGVSVSNKAGFGTGTLMLGDSVTAPANAITITAVTDLSGANAIANALVFNQDFSLAGDNLEFSAAADLGAVVRTITANNAAGKASILSGPITGTGGALTKAGTGTLILKGIDTFTGATTINAGLLEILGTVNGTSKVDVSGILGGTGSIIPAVNGDITLLAGGKLAPGASAGTLSLLLGGTGKFDISAGVLAANSQSLAFELDAPLASDKVTLTGGALSIGSGVLEFDDFNFTTLPGFVGTADYTLFDGDTAIAGTLGPNVSGLIGGNAATFQFADGGRDLIVHVVPEPQSVVLLLGALGSVLGMRRRTRRRLLTLPQTPSADSDRI